VIDADAVTVFKPSSSCTQNIDATLERYVTFDFETTDKDVETCGVVKSGAGGSYTARSWRGFTRS